MEGVVVGLVNGIAGQKVDVFLCTTRHEGALAEKIHHEVVRYRIHRRGTLDVAALLAFRSFVRRDGIEIVHAHGSSVFFAAAATFGMGVRLVWHAHYGRLAAGTTAPLPYRLVSHQLDGIIAVSKGLELWCRKLPAVAATRIWRLPNFLVPESAAEGVQVLPGTKGKRIVCVCNIRPEKDVASLVRAMAIVTKHEPDACLLIVGGTRDSACHAALQELVLQEGLVDRVFFLGPRDDVRQLLRHCDIGVLSSVFEGFPLTLLEYGEAGLAVVSTAVGECPEILDHGGAGMLVPPDDHVALAEALSLLLADGVRRRQLAGALRPRVNAEYSRESVLRRLSDVYCELMPAGAASGK
jgi:glycosyltransferase involved in cell wall biosynthesis